MKKLIFHFIFLAIAMSSCSSDDCIEGDGTVISENRIVSDYTSVSNLSTIDIIISGRSDSNDIIEISGEQNIVEVLTTDIIENTLEIDYDSNCIMTNSSPIVTVAQDDLDIITNTSTGDIMGVISSANLTINNESTGDISLSGSTLNNLTISNEGTGDIIIDNIESNIVMVENGGTGDIYVTAVNSLSGSISGTGDVYYKGSPTLDVEVSGTGELIDNN